jgi:hypothetical protein
MKKKKKIKPEGRMRWIDFGIFPGYVLFCYNMEHKQILKELTKKKADTWEYAIRNDGLFFDSPIWAAMFREVMSIKTKKKVKLYYIVVPTEFNFTDYDYCRLAHEVLHICQFYLSDILNREQEKEAEAYLHTYLMLECLKVIREK